MARLLVLLVLAAAPVAKTVESDALIRREALADVSVHQTPELPEGMTENLAPAPRATPVSHDEPEHPSVYEYAVMASKPIAYWSMGNVSADKKTSAKGRACGAPGALRFGDPCRVDGEINGSPTLRGGLLTSSPKYNAMKFSGADDEEVIIPDSSFINTNASGYTERTVELWFETDSAAKAEGDINRTIYCEGNEAHSGLNMYVSEDGAGELWLNMFAWDRGNHDTEFGTLLVDPEPIRCPIKKNTTYYTVMEFNGNNHSFTGWIGRPAGLELCGQITDVPINVRLRHHGHGGGNAVIAGVHTSSRASGIVQMLANSHNFKGTVDEVAIYNHALRESEIHSHWTAGTTGSNK